MLRKAEGLVTSAGRLREQVLAALALIGYTSVDQEEDRAKVQGQGGVGPMELEHDLIKDLWDEWSPK